MKTESTHNLTLSAKQCTVLLAIISTKEKGRAV